MKKQIDIGIVIVNYNNHQDTIECVDSFIRYLDTNSFKIVIIDNCSPNSSGLILKNKYENENFVDVVLSQTNTGNTGGWNAGLDYIRKMYIAKYIVLSDNDVVLLDKSFFQNLEKEYRVSQFAALGPMIITPDGKCDCNPIFDVFYSRENANYDLKYWNRRLKASKIGLDKAYCFFRTINPFIKKHKKKVYQSRKQRTPGLFLKKRENVVLHGCFLILSPLYFEHFDRLDQRTFMYAEEDILYAHLTKAHLKTVYSPHICVYHKEGSSVKNNYINKRRRCIFLYTNYIKAIKEYLLLLDELGL